MSTGSRRASPTTSNNPVSPRGGRWQVLRGETSGVDRWLGGAQRIKEVSVQGKQGESEAGNGNESQRKNKVAQNPRSVLWNLRGLSSASVPTHAQRRKIERKREKRRPRFPPVAGMADSFYIFF